MKDKAEKKGLIRETIRLAWKPYRRLYSLRIAVQMAVLPGLVLGFLFGVTKGFLPLVLRKVTSAIFHGAAPKATDLTHRSELLSAGGSVNSIVFICLLIPAVMTVRSLMDTATPLHELGQQPRRHRHSQRAFPQDSRSIDGFL